jgi:hypothetical protein
VSYAAHGRHRATPPAGGRSRGVQVAGVVAIVVVGTLLIGTLAWWLSARDPDSDTLADADSPGSSPSMTDIVPSASTSSVESERIVTVEGAIVTVEETSRVVDGSRARATPPTEAPTGLRLIDAGVVSADGRATAFDSPVSLQRSGSLTVRAEYRLTDCPDVLPAVWPSPTQFPDATQTYTRLDQPLHTSYAICPKDRFQSSRSSGITGELVPGELVRIQLSWQGGDTLSVSGVGSASGVAAVVVENGPGCGSVASCVAILEAVNESNETRTASFSMQPVDPCPPQTDSDRLVLLVTGGSFPPEPTSIEVEGLHGAVCQ